MWPCTVQVKVNICTSIMHSPPPPGQPPVLLQWPVMDHPLSVSFIYQFSSGHASVKDVSGYFYFHCIVPSFSMGFLINVFIVFTPLCAFCVYYLLIYVYTIYTMGLDDRHFHDSEEADAVQGRTEFGVQISQRVVE